MTEAINRFIEFIKYLLTCQVQPEAQLTSLVVQHDGLDWPLWRADDTEAYILDIDWAVRLGYANPPQIRELIARMISDGQLGVVRTVRKTSSPSGGRPATEYYLTEGQALKVAARSKTKSADKMLDGLIAVFMKARKGELGSSSAQPAEIIDEVKLPAPIMGEIVATLRSNREMQSVTMNLLMQMTQRITQPGAVPALESPAVAPAQPATVAMSATIESSPAAAPAKRKRRHGQMRKVKARRRHAPAASPESRVDVVIAAFEKLSPDITLRRVAEQTGLTAGQVERVVGYLKARGRVRQAGSSPFEPHWELCEAAASPSAAPLNTQPQPPEPPAQKTTRELLNDHIRNYCKLTGKISYNDAWSALYSQLAMEGRDCRNRKSHGHDVAKIDYLDAHGWAPRALELARRMFPLPQDRTS